MNPWQGSWGFNYNAVNSLNANIWFANEASTYGIHARFGVSEPADQNSDCKMT